MPLNWEDHGLNSKEMSINENIYIKTIKNKKKIKSFNFDDDFFRHSTYVSKLRVTENATEAELLSGVWRVAVFENKAVHHDGNIHITQCPSPLQSLSKTI